MDMAEFFGDLIGRIVVFVGTIAIGGILGCAFMYVGWNWGIVPAVGSSHEIGWDEAFCLAVFVSAVASIFKLSFRKVS